MGKSSIEWTDLTWNPTTGCDKVSEGCKYCYAEVMSRRLKGMGKKKYKDGFKLTIHPDELIAPNKWKTPSMVFVNSMSDLFHEKIPTEFIHKVFKVMNNNPQHIFQILTKRAERFYEINNEFEWTQNIWMGVTVENQNNVQRVDYLRNSDAVVKFLSLEPLIGPLNNIELNNIDWVIVGGESGLHPRPIKKEWVLDIKEQCEKEKIPFFFKQWGGRNKKASGRLLNGKVYSEMPKIFESLSNIIL